MFDFTIEVCAVSPQLMYNKVIPINLLPPGSVKFGGQPRHEVHRTLARKCTLGGLTRTWTHSCAQDRKAKFLCTCVKLLLAFEDGLQICVFVVARNTHWGPTFLSGILSQSG